MRCAQSTIKHWKENTDFLLLISELAIVILLTSRNIHRENFQRTVKGADGQVL